MQKCKYLDEIGLNIKDYGTNFTEPGDKREARWAKEREECGFDDRETWNLDISFVEWIYTRVNYHAHAVSNIILWTWRAKSMSLRA